MVDVRLVRARDEESSRRKNCAHAISTFPLLLQKCKELACDGLPDTVVYSL